MTFFFKKRHIFQRSKYLCLGGYCSQTHNLQAVAHRRWMQAGLNQKAFSGDKTSSECKKATKDFLQPAVIERSKNRLVNYEERQS